MKTLREYASEEGISYAGAYKRYVDKRIQDCYKGADGKIYIGKVEEIEQKQTAPVMFDNLPSTVSSFNLNEATATSTRTNRSASIRLADRFIHLENSPVPFTFTGSAGYREGDVSVRDAIILCQRAYWGFSIFKATIELFTEFCVNNIYFKGGSKKSRSFFEMFFKKVGINKIQDMFYRELWRSGNCFIYKYMGRLQGKEYKDLVKLFDGNVTRSNAEIPIEYILLNPADIQAQGNITFARPTYLQVLSDYELERLRNPRTDQDQAVFNTLSPDEQKRIKQKGRTGVIYRQLDTKSITSVFLAKQSYEAFSVPLGFGVLEHLNHKKELELMDQAIARTVQQAVLLVTTGAPQSEGGINYKNIENLRKIFENESIGRVLISDYTTKVQFVIPTIADILDPRKYEEINASIAIGLGNVFLIQGEKFANQNAKIDIFLQRLQGARRLFIDEFLIPEMRNISDQLGFKGEVPDPYYEELDLKNEIEYNKIYVRLMELGLLTASEGFTAMDSGRLPSVEDSLESQKAYKESRDKGLYKPLLSKDPDQAEGRPAGSKAPQSTKKISPIGAEFSATKVKDNLIKAQVVEANIKETLMKKHNLESLTPDQEIIVTDILTTIIKNETVDNWNSCVAEYIDDPDKQSSISMEVDAICSDHGVDSYLGGILFNSKIDKEIV